MTANALKKYYNARAKAYFELATECGSVAELLFKVEVYGSKWTKWDWIMFLSFLDYQAFGYDDGPDRSLFSQQPLPPDEGKAMSSLLQDVFDTLDNGTALDAVFTNKNVVMNFISWLESGYRTRKLGIYRLLAHAFRKFPGMWTMNWMFVRHRKSGKRTHRMAHSLPEMAGRGKEYFESSAFLDDFVHRYWRAK